MKGTLFSADFIEDSSGNLRLMELNTDTAIQDSGLPHLDFSEFITVLSDSNISEVVIIHKTWHNNLVSAISESLNQSAPFVTSFDTILEEDTTIYPTSVTDASNKFILRMAYDESAIFDSEYTKNKKNVLELFYDSGDSGSIVEYYVSSSADGVTDILPNEFNSPNIPDVVTKNLSTNVNSPLSFFKIGKSTLTDSERYTELKSSFDEDTLVLKFYENPADEKVRSIRSMNIIYGGNLDILNLGTYIGEALFPKPDSIDFDDTLIATETHRKHYYELTTSFPKFSTVDNWGGIFEEEEIVKADGTTVLIPSASIGDEFKSYFIEGAPDTDIVPEFMEWSYPGSQLPSGSHITSSILINNIQQHLVYGLVYHFTLEDGSDFRAAVGSHMLIYDSINDCIRYEDLHQISLANHKFIDFDGNLVDIQSINIEILDGYHFAHILDMEQADTFFLSNGHLSVKIVTHNCFPAGTKITLGDGSQKNIEDLTTDDTLLTWNEKTGDLVEGAIGNIIKTIDNLLIHLTTSQGEIKSTPFHKFYVKGKKWIPAQDIVIGDILFNQQHQEVNVIGKDEIVGQVEVYHILDVKDNHTYFAENLLVHNIKYGCFIAGTEITLANGDIKNIEDVLIGEEVLTYNEISGETELGVVGDLKQHEVDSVIRLVFEDEIVIVTTHEHPFFVNDKGWVKAGELQISDVCKNVSGNDSSILTIEVLEETHKVYNLLSVSENHNFFANGILVHNKL